MVTVEVQPIGRVKHIINIVFAVLIIVLYYTVILLPHFPWGILLFLLLTYGVFGIWVIIDFYCRYYRNPYRFDINEDIITIFLKPLLATDKKLTKKKAFFWYIQKKTSQYLKNTLLDYSPILTMSLFFNQI